MAHWPADYVRETVITKIGGVVGNAIIKVYFLSVFVAIT